MNGSKSGWEVKSNSQLNITFSKASPKSRVRKRSSESTEVETSNKKTKMMDAAVVKKTIEETVALSRTVFMHDIEAKLEQNKNAVIEAVQSDLKPIAETVNQISKEQDLMREREVLRDIRVGKLESEFEDLKEIVEKRGEGESDAAFKYNLAAEVERANKNLIIHGLRIGAGKDAAIDIIKGIGEKNEIEFEIKRCTPLGKGANNKQSVMISFENAYQRNTILQNAQGLPKDIFLDRDIPRLYRDAFKRFRRKQWRLRNFLGYQTQISFTSHILQLKYKEEGKAYTIDEEYVPSIKDSLKTVKGNKSEGGNIPTPVIQKDDIDLARNSVIITGAKKIPEKDLKEMVKEALDPALYNDIQGWKKMGGNWLLRFPSEAIAKAVKTKYKDSLKKDANINIDTFV